MHLNEPLLFGWYLKEELRELWSQTSRKQMKAFLDDWCEKAITTGIGQMMKMAKTLRTHASGILAYSDHPITSAKLEGINIKIKTLTKRSYGFHDEDFFILKLFSLHHSRYKLLG
jgi:transposase